MFCPNSVGSHIFAPGSNTHDINSLATYDTLVHVQNHFNQTKHRAKFAWSLPHNLVLTTLGYCFGVPLQIGSLTKALVTSIVTFSTCHIISAIPVSYPQTEKFILIEEQPEVNVTCNQYKVCLGPSKVNGSIGGVRM